MTLQMMILLVAFVATVLLLALPMGRWLAAVATPAPAAAGAGAGAGAGASRPSALHRVPNAVLRACGV